MPKREIYPALGGRESASFPGRMSSDRLRSALYYSTPKPPSRPPPLWQIAAGLDTAAVPAVEEMRRPATSAVPAGWICVGIGLLTAWFFPLAHVFFSIAIILSVVAMATHQVRSGMALLAGALASIGVCAILFLCGVAMIVAGALGSVTKTRSELAAASRPVPTTPRAIPAVTVRLPVTQEGMVRGNPNGVLSRPVALTEVLSLLAAGRREDEILAAAAGRVDPSRIGPSEITSLRAYGASEQLIDSLRRPSGYRSANVSATHVVPPPAPPQMVATAPAFPVTQAAGPAVPIPAPVNYAVRDRQIADLKARIEQIDETIRRVRADPHYYGLIKGSTNTARQQSSDEYLDQLDKQRNDLRRQKWALEGR